MGFYIPCSTTSSLILLAPRCSFRILDCASTHLGTMRYVTRSTAIVLAMFALGVSAASAQHPQTRKGFWIGFGFGMAATASRAAAAADSVARVRFHRPHQNSVGP